MKIDYKIKEIDFNNYKEIENILNLLNKAFSTTKFNKKWWKWKYSNNPFGQPLGWIAVDKNEYLGVRLLWPWEFIINGNIVKAYQAVDTATNPKFKRMGIFSKLLNRSIEKIKQEKTFIFNFPNENSFPAYRKFNWKIIKQNKWIIYPVFLRLNNLIRLFSNNKSELFLGNPSIKNTIEKKPATNWDMEKLKWRFKEKPGINYFQFINNSDLVIYKLRKRFFINEAIIVFSNITKKNSFNKLCNHFMERKILLISYNGINSYIYDLLQKTKLAITINRKMNYVYNDFDITNYPINNIKLEFAETDFG